MRFSLFVFLFAGLNVPRVFCTSAAFWQSIFDWLNGGSSSSPPQSSPSPYSPYSPIFSGQSTTRSPNSRENDFYDAIAELFGLDYESSSEENHRPGGSNGKPQPPSFYPMNYPWQQQQWPPAFPPGSYYGQQPSPWSPPSVQSIPNAPPIASIPTGPPPSNPTSSGTTAIVLTPSSEADPNSTPPATPSTIPAAGRTTVTTTAAPGNTTTTEAPGNATTTAAPGNATTTAVPGNATTTAAPGNATTTAAPAAGG